MSQNGRYKRVGIFNYLKGLVMDRLSEYTYVITFFALLFIGLSFMFGAIFLWGVIEYLFHYEKINFWVPVIGLLLFIMGIILNKLVINLRIRYFNSLSDKEKKKYCVRFPDLRESKDYWLQNMLNRYRS